MYIHVNVPICKANIIANVSSMLMSILPSSFGTPIPFYHKGFTDPPYANWNWAKIPSPVLAVVEQGGVEGHEHGAGIVPQGAGDRGQHARDGQQDCDEIQAHGNGNV